MDPIDVVPRPGEGNDEQKRYQINEVEEDLAPCCQAANKGHQAYDDYADSSLA